MYPDHPWVIKAETVMILASKPIQPRELLAPPDLGIKQQAGAGYPRVSSIRLGSPCPRWEGGWFPHGQRQGALFQRVQGRSLLHPSF